MNVAVQKSKNYCKLKKKKRKPFEFELVSVWVAECRRQKGHPGSSAAHRPNEWHKTIIHPSLLLFCSPNHSLYPSYDGGCGTFSFPLCSSIIFKLGHLMVPGGTIWDSHKGSTITFTILHAFFKFLPPFT
jgi:hypothetical protein